MSSYLFLLTELSSKVENIPETVENSGSAPINGSLTTLERLPNVQHRLNDIPFPDDLLFHTHGQYIPIVKPFTVAIANYGWMVGKVHKCGSIHPIFNKYHQMIGVHETSRYVRLLSKEEIYLHQFIHPNQFSKQKHKKCDVL